MILICIFWLSVISLLHTYVIFPLILSFAARNKTNNRIVYRNDEILPLVSIIMAVHNEEHVIADKIRSIYYTLYPLSRFEVLVGSDASSDGTNRILRVYEENYEQFKSFEYKNRLGKGKIINTLAVKAKGEILILTDANVFLQFNTIFEMVKHFKNTGIGLVDTRVIHRGNMGKGISLPEVAYIMREVSIKEKEGIAWGTMMGPLGGCFAIRKELFEPIPSNFLVDDFFINMTILFKKYKAINSHTSYASEDISISLKEEFRRKIRIAAGNFQNLARFAGLLWPPYNPTGFCFLSHKVLRWFGPLFILSAFFSGILLSHIAFYKYASIIQIVFFVLPLADLLLKRLKIEIIFLRFVTHFLIMNLALLAGFMRYVFGIKSNIWQPTRRNQSE